MTRWTLSVMALLIATPAPAQIRCGGCCLPSPTLHDECRAAHLVIYGTLAERRTADGHLAPAGDRTELRILGVLKGATTLEGRDVLRLRRDLAIEDPRNPPKYLIFCDVAKDKIDPYRGIPASAPTLAYLKGIVALEGKSRPAHLRYFFDHLNASDSTIAGDAFQEIDRADYADYRALAKKLSADQIASLLTKPDIAVHRRYLYAFLLGHCGKADHAESVRRFLDEPKHWNSAGIDRAVIGYILLQPKEGTAYLRELLKEPATDFLRRYAGLRALRFFWKERPDVIAKEEVLTAMGRLLDQADIADMAIEDLRTWKQWHARDQVLSLTGKKSHDIPIVRRAILRFALCCPDKRAAAFVADMRKKDALWVGEVEQLLKLESKK